MVKEKILIKRNDVVITSVYDRSLLSHSSPSRNRFKNSFYDVWLLLKKNFIIQLRHPVLTLLESLLPCLFVLIVAIIRTKVDFQRFNQPTRFPENDFNAVSPKISNRYESVSILYAPKTDLTDRIITETIEQMNRIERKRKKSFIGNVFEFFEYDTSIQFEANGFNSTEKMIQRYQSLNISYEELILCAIEFDQINSTNDVRFTLRFSNTPRIITHTTLSEGLMGLDWRTPQIIPVIPPGPRNRNESDGGSPGYVREGFLYVQHQLSWAIARIFFDHNHQTKNISKMMENEIDGDLEDEGNENLIDLNRMISFDFSIRRFPFPPYIKDYFLFLLNFLFPSIIMFSFLYFTINLVKTLVNEKEKRLKESMKMMGLREKYHWMAHFIKAITSLIPSLFLIVLLMRVRLASHSIPLLTSDFSLLFVYLLLYVVTNVCWCFMMSTFFSKANMAGVISGLVFYMSLAPYFILFRFYNHISFGSKLMQSLIPNTNMALGIYIILMRESRGLPNTWTNWTEPAVPNDQLSLLIIFAMCLVNSSIYLLVTWYVSLVFPGEFGIPVPWHVPFTDLLDNFFTIRTRRPINSKVSTLNKETSLNNHDSVNSVTDHLVNRFDFEPDPQNYQSGISLRNLSKSYDRGKTWAVSDLSFDVFINQITVLLGHNGAGKTSTISMLIGLYPPSKGTALVNNLDIRTQMLEIRSSLGICPQFNVLFDEMTVEEHLKFYCQLKNGINGIENVSAQVTEMIEKLDMVEKRKEFAANLSGGMKRKLSIGIALIGGSKIVILDEPTTGMDVSARHFVWDLLLREKQNRAILISTHFMEEADVLGDRIAIMAGGHLQCYGSPMFLKRRFGSGYYLNIVKKNLEADTNRISQVIERHVPNSKLESSVGVEVTFSLPNEETEKFESLLNLLEIDQSLSIASYGISITTMDEVFLKVGNYAKEKIDMISTKNTEINNNQSAQNNQNANSPNKLSAFDNSELSPIIEQKHRGPKLLAQQFRALIVKRLLYSMRSYRLTMAQFLSPLTIVLLTLIRLHTVPVFQDDKKLEMSLHQFRSPMVQYFYDDQSGHSDEVLNELSRRYHQSVLRDLSNEDRLLKLKNSSDEFVEEKILSVDSQTYSNNFFIAAQLIKLNLHDAKDNESSSFFDFPLSEVSSKRKKTKYRLISLFNNQAFHSPSVSLKYLDEALIGLLYNLSDFHLTVNNHPLPMTITEKSKFSFKSLNNEFQIMQSLIVAFAFIGGSFSLLIVKERSVNSRHLQQVCGLRLSIYWFSFFIVDYVIYLISSVLVIALFFAFKQDGLHENWQPFYLLMGFGMFGAALLPLVYSMSFMFRLPATAYVRVSLILSIAGILTLIADQITQIEQFDLKDVNSFLRPFFKLFVPLYNLGKMTNNLQINHMNTRLCTMEVWNGMKVKDFCDSSLLTKEQLKFIIPCCQDKCSENCLIFEPNYLALKEPGIGSLLIYTVFSAAFYWMLLVMIEIKLIERIMLLMRNLKQKFLNKHSKKVKLKEPFQNDEMLPMINLDDDVIAESRHVEEILDKSNDPQSKQQLPILLIRNLRKKFGEFSAVDEISFSVNRGECFGMLGINGAGKTTTFKMITGDESITSGEILLNGINLGGAQNYEILQQIGYCPQFDALLDELTGAETMRFFARLRGVPEEQIQHQITSLSRLLYFEMHLNKQVGHYSGGNKRKLSTAVALLGDPFISFLDEPTSGMDPVARRCLWEAIMEKIKQGLSIVLCSHSMEECEALCHRLIIMVNGRICCIGSPLYLKNKFGDSYTVLVKISIPNSANLKHRQSSVDHNVDDQPQQQQDSLEQRILNVQNFFTQTFSTSSLKAIHNNLLHYIIEKRRLSEYQPQQQQQQQIKCSQIFGLIECNKKLLLIEDYSVCQTNLEQIFLMFARFQREQHETEQQH